MLTIAAVLLAAIAGAAAERRFDVTGWLLHAWAKGLGGKWLIDGGACPGCGREVHIMRHSETAGRDLCLRCVNGAAR